MKKIHEEIPEPRLREELERSYKVARNLRTKLMFTIGLLVLSFTDIARRETGNALKELTNTATIKLRENGDLVIQNTATVIETWRLERELKEAEKELQQALNNAKEDAEPNDALYKKMEHLIEELKEKIRELEKTILENGIEITPTNFEVMEKDTAEIR